MGDHIVRPAVSTPDEEVGKGSNERGGGRERASPEGVLELLADRNARTVMVLTAEGPLSVDDIVDRCEMSAATAYRKVNRLVEAGLITESVRVRPEGTNFREFELRVGSVHVSLADDNEPDVALEERLVSTPSATPRVSTDGGTRYEEHQATDERADERQERYKQLFTEVTGTEEVTETRDAAIETRYIDEEGERSVSQYVTSVARDNGLSDTLSEPEN